MAYPEISAPYGLKAVNRVDGLPYAGVFRTIPVVASNAAMFYGDAVKIVNGRVDKDTGTDAATPCGVFVGVEYPNAEGLPTFSQHVPANTVGAVAYVVDDPATAFRVAVVSGTTVIAGVSRDVVGSNMALVQNAGNTRTGRSGVAVLSTSSAVTATLPVRVIDVVTDTAIGADSFVELIVKINTHQYNNTTGV
jgi:hypothetical protein